MSTEIYRESVANAMPGGTSVEAAADAISAAVGAPTEKKRRAFTPAVLERPEVPLQGKHPDALSVEDAADKFADIAEDEAQPAPVPEVSKEPLDVSPETRGPGPLQSEPLPGPLGQQVHQAREQLLTEAAEYESRRQSIDWAGLRQTNPAEYAALKGDFSEARTRLQSREQEIVGIEQEIDQGLQQHQQEQLAQAASAQYATCIKTIPGWKEPAKRQKDTEDMTKYLLDSGFPRERVAALHAMPDPDLVGLVYKAMMHDRSEKPEPRGRAIRLKRNRNPSQPAWKAAASKEMREANVRNPHSVEAAAVKLKHLMGR